MKIKFLMAALALTLGAAKAQAHESPDCPMYFAKSDLCGAVEFITPPSETAEASFHFKVYDHASTPDQPVLVDPAELKIDLWMYMGHHGGHGSAPVKITRESQGIYRVTEAYFIMPGRWNMRFWVNGEKRELIVDVKPAY